LSLLLFSSFSIIDKLPAAVVGVVKSKDILEFSFPCC
jgi:hypothetical protein